MNFTDTHTHLYLKHFNKDLSQVMQRTFDAGVNRVLLPNINSSTVSDLLSLEERYPNQCFPMMGLHPCYVSKNVEEEVSLVKNWHNKKKFIAVGEIGLDFYHDTSFAEEQKWAFKEQLVLAKKLNLPVSIHCRESFNEIINCFDELNFQKIKGVFHCFTGSANEAKKIIEYGLKLGVGGVLTFKNSALAKNIRAVKLGDLVLETDSPYLTPEPFRGKRNESSYIQLIAKKLAEIFNRSTGDVSRETEKNVKLVFGI